MVWLLEGVVLALFQKGPWVNADSPLQRSAVPAIAVCPLSRDTGLAGLAPWCRGLRLTAFL